MTGYRLSTRCPSLCQRVKKAIKQCGLIVTAAGLSGCYAYMPRHLPDISTQEEAVSLDRAQIFTTDGSRFFLQSVTIRRDSVTGMMADSTVAIGRADVERIAEHKLSIAATTILVGLTGAVLLAATYAAALQRSLK